MAPSFTQGSMESASPLDRIAFQTALHHAEAGALQYCTRCANIVRPLPYFQGLQDGSHPSNLASR